jgi:hypothetical protein
MGKNAFLDKQRKEKRFYFDAGLQMGRQQIIDMFCLALNDPDVMGKDTFGKDRLLKVIKSVGDYIDVFQKAWERDDETDYYRCKLDERLAEIYGDGMIDTFLIRYEYCTEFNYFTGKWGK